MDDLLILMNWLLPLLYMALLIDYGATFFLGVRVNVRTPQALAVIAVHVTLLVLRGVRLGHPPLVSNFDVLSLIAVSTALVYWVLESVGRDRRAGLFVFALIFLFQYTSSVFLAGAAESSARFAWERLHVVPAVLAYTAMTFAGVYGWLHLVSRRNLKRHRFGLLFDRLPPLEKLGRGAWHALLVGFVFTTISVASGALLYAHGAFEPSSASRIKIASKIAVGSVAWLIGLATVLGRGLGKWDLTRVARVAVAGFVLVMVLLVASAALS